MTPAPPPGPRRSPAAQRPAPTACRAAPRLRIREVVPRALVRLAHRAPSVVQVVALGDRGHHGHQPHLQMILIDRARSLVHWCDGQQSKIRMQEPRGKISGNKLGNSGNRGGNSGLTRTGRRRQSRRCRGRRTCPSALLGHGMRAARFRGGAACGLYARRHGLRPGARRAHLSCRGQGEPVSGFLGHSPSVSASWATVWRGCPVSLKPLRASHRTPRPAQLSCASGSELLPPCLSHLWVLPLDMSHRGRRG
jgi:hypothetical protein